MPIVLNLGSGQIKALTLKEAAKRLGGASVEDIKWWLECDLLFPYKQSVTNDSGRERKYVLYVDYEDVEDVLRLARKFLPGAPWERILWFRYEAAQQQGQAAKRSQHMQQDDFEDEEDDELIEAPRPQPRHAVQHRQIVEQEEYYPEPDAETEKETRHYPRQKQPILNKRRGRWI